MIAGSRYPTEVNTQINGVRIQQHTFPKPSLTSISSTIAMPGRCVTLGGNSTFLYGFHQTTVGETKLNVDIVYDRITRITLFRENANDQLELLPKIKQIATSKIQPTLLSEPKRLADLQRLLSTRASP